MKANWSKYVSKYMCEKSGESVNKYTFASVFKEAWVESLKPATLINSFKRSGICPLNRDAISDKKLLPSSIMCAPDAKDVQV